MTRDPQQRCYSATANCTKFRRHMSVIRAGAIWAARCSGLCLPTPHCANAEYLQLEGQMTAFAKDWVWRRGGPHFHRTVYCKLSRQECPSFFMQLYDEIVTSASGHPWAWLSEPRRVREVSPLLTHLGGPSTGRYFPLLCQAPTQLTAPTQNGRNYCRKALLGRFMRGRSDRLHSETMACFRSSGSDFIGIRI